MACKREETLEYTATVNNFHSVKSKSTYSLDLGGYAEKPTLNQEWDPYAGSEFISASFHNLE